MLRLRVPGDGTTGCFNAAQKLGSVGASYPFKAGQILNLDASDVVIAGDSPSGAHSDIFDSEPAWVVGRGRWLERCVGQMSVHSYSFGTIYIVAP
jgi:hypothetical protein